MYHRSNLTRCIAPNDPPGCAYDIGDKYQNPHFYQVFALVPEVLTGNTGMGTTHEQLDIEAHQCRQRDQL